LRFIAAGLATCGSVILGVLVFSAIGGFLFHRGVIDDATLFSFPLYGIIPGFIVGGVLYTLILIGKQDSN
jgi:hypothetical protein